MTYIEPSLIKKLKESKNLKEAISAFLDICDRIDDEEIAYSEYTVDYGKSEEWGDAISIMKKLFKKFS